MKVKIFLRLLFFFLIFLPKNIYAADGLAGIADQGKIRTCLTADQGGGGRRGSFQATVHLTGTCASPTGCEVWHYNSANTEIANNEAQAAICADPPKTGHVPKICSDPEALKRKSAQEVAVSPGWTKIITSVPAGPVDTTYAGTFIGHVNYSYYAIGENIPVAKTAKGGIEAENQTQQIGQVSNFEFLETEGSEQDCVSISWDPFGRVFDAVSLEPLWGVDVSLFENTTKRLVSLPGNPNTTNLGGVYNIQVEQEGDYYLTADAPPTHSFIKNFSPNKNTSLIYSDIYRPGEIFHETPLPYNIPKDFDFSQYHHDIPLQPKGKPYFDAQAKVIAESLNQADMGNFISFSGRVTFPLANVCLVGEMSGVIGCTGADKYGNFKIKVNKLSLPQEFMEIIVEKVNLTEASEKNVMNKIIGFLVKKVNAQSSIIIDPATPTAKPVGFNPILSYLEGYAYGEEGVVIPSAKIIIKLKATNEVFSQTSADETGFFTIYSNNLPFFEYYLQIDGPDGKIVRQTTPEFVSLNQDYLSNQDLDLIRSTRGGSSIVNPETGDINTIISRPTPTVIPQTVAALNSQILLLVILLTFLMITLGGTVFYIIKKGK